MFARIVCRSAAAAIFLTLAGGTRADSKAVDAADVKALAARIDGHIAAAWRAHRVKPADPADDAAFLRRVYLDLVGQVPALTEVRDFLDDPAADKRARLVESLLATDAHARHFATAWRMILMPNATQFTFGASTPLEQWLQLQVRDNTGYDQVARAILGGKGPANGALGGAPEEMAAAASRVFLGVRLECAQCHDHPFARWKKQQFWEFTAYFSRGQATLPNTTRVVKARPPVGPPPQEGADPREVLAGWVTHKDNPYFARAAVNRLWQHFFGVGLVDPVDGLGEDHPPSHPALLDELARSFAEHKYDVNFLVRAITASKTYGLSSGISDASQGEQRRFARAAVRGLTAEQFYDSLAVVTGRGAALDLAPDQGIPLNAFGPRGVFLARFAARGKPLEAEASVLQSLHLMNGRPMADATSLAGNPLLRTVADAEGPTAAQRVEELYLLALARRPRPEESARLARYVESGGARGDRKAALADIFWALLNSPEFALNH